MKKESLWTRCPFCDGKTRVKVFEDTVLINFPLYCQRCKREAVINMVKLKSIISKEPDA